MMDATVYLLKCGCTLCPASLIVRPWLTTWSTKVARISSEITVLGLPRPRPPRPPPLTLTPLALPLFHCSKTEELTCCPFMLKLWLLIVKLCDGCLPLWWVSVHIWIAVCSLWKQDIFCMKIVPKAENCV